MSAVSTHPSILIVEDHADTAEMLRRYLKRNGYDAEIVPTGDAALSSLSQHRPACVILDQTMPGMTGLDLMRELHGNPDVADIPVYFYSAAFDQSKQREAQSLGAKGWYIKGISRLSDLMDNVMATAGGETH